MKLFIREFALGDVKGLHDITLKSMDEFYKPEVFYDFYSRWPAGQLVACNVIGKPVGYISTAIVDDWVARILLFAVDPEYRGRGIGAQLLSAFRMKVVMSGVRYITLEVRTENHSARKFYKKNGFTETSVYENYYQDGGAAIRMDGPAQLFN